MTTLSPVLKSANHANTTPNNPPKKGFDAITVITVKKIFDDFNNHHLLPLNQEIQIYKEIHDKYNLIRNEILGIPGNKTDMPLSLTQKNIITGIGNSNAQTISALNDSVMKEQFEYFALQVRVRIGDISLINRGCWLIEPILVKVNEFIIEHFSALAFGKVIRGDEVVDKLGQPSLAAMLLEKAKFFPDPTFAEFVKAIFDDIQRENQTSRTENESDRKKLKEHLLEILTGPSSKRYINVYRCCCERIRDIGSIENSRISQAIAQLQKLDFDTPQMKKLEAEASALKANLLPKIQLLNNLNKYYSWITESWKKLGFVSFSPTTQFKELNRQIYDFHQAKIKNLEAIVDNQGKLKLQLGFKS